jgi:hypothetical protein
MKRLSVILLIASGVFLAGCGDTYYVVTPKPQSGSRAPIKYSGGSSTYSSDSAEGFRAVGPSN